MVVSLRREFGRSMSIGRFGDPLIVRADIGKKLRTAITVRSLLRSNELAIITTRC